MHIKELLQSHFKASSVKRKALIQRLWSGYGEIIRYELLGASVPSVIVKNIQVEKVNNHPRGWNTHYSHLRKVKSYQVEQAWYSLLAKKHNQDCRIPICYLTAQDETKQLIVLEDLDAVGFSKRRTSLSPIEAKLVLKWLANFHACFLDEKPIGLWEQGSYWHLESRPDEFNALLDGPLKEAAGLINTELKESKYNTIIHGDAKVANFCFSDNMKGVAAVDFQYVGGGCGMKDVAYFLGSCLSEQECEDHEKEFLSHYFNELKNALGNRSNNFNFNSLEKEWRRLYPIAWADFTRFLLGWMPDHQKINGYSLKMVEKALHELGHEAHN